VTIEFDGAYEYVGGQRWDLLGIADAEQHLFVRPGSLYWVQFERFLPGSEGAYGYSADWVTDIGGLDFICDARAYAGYDALNRDPESDGACAQRLLEGRGYAFPEAAVRLRAIHLPAADRRRELMIIHAQRVDAAALPAGSEEGLLLQEDSELAKKAFRTMVSGMTIIRR
jgi:hypothetical protein